MNNHIKEFWDAQPLKYGCSHGASWEDRYMINLEVETMSQYISDGDAVLDVGCANGYSTFLQSERHCLKSITGIDYSENMIKYAIQNKAQKKHDHAEFQVGDIRALDFPDNSFDVVYTTRVLINLISWEEQKKAIDECIRVAKTGGKVIFSEAFWEPLVILNAMRALKGLSPLVEHDFNRYLKKSKMEEYLAAQNLSFIINDFSSLYYLGSRFLRELLGYKGFENELNEEFYRLEQKFSGSGIGIQQAYIVTKG